MTMRLTDLNPRLLRRELSPGHEVWVRVETVAEADYLQFLCPKCFELNGGPTGTHRVMCGRPHLPADAPCGPGRWEIHGTSFEDFSLVAGSSSVALIGGCEAHFFVRNGQIEMV